MGQGHERWVRARPTARRGLPDACAPPPRSRWASNRVCACLRSGKKKKAVGPSALPTLRPVLLAEARVSVAPPPATTQGHGWVLIWTGGCD